MLPSILYPSYKICQYKRYRNTESYYLKIRFVVIYPGICMLQDSSKTSGAQSTPSVIIEIMSKIILFVCRKIVKNLEKVCINKILIT